MKLDKWHNISEPLPDMHGAYLVLHNDGSTAFFSGYRVRLNAHNPPTHWSGPIRPSDQMPDGSPTNHAPVINESQWNKGIR